MNKLLGIAFIALGLAAGPVFAADAGCEKQADEKKLAGAARTSFVTKCEKDMAGGGDAMAMCEKSAADKKLAGAAKDSHIKKCVKDAGAAPKK